MPVVQARIRRQHDGDGLGRGKRRMATHAARIRRDHWKAKCLALNVGLATLRGITGHKALQVVQGQASGGILSYDIGIARRGCPRPPTRRRGRR